MPGINRELPLVTVANFIFDKDVTTEQCSTTVEQECRTVQQEVCDKVAQQDCKVGLHYSLSFYNCYLG